MSMSKSTQHQCRSQPLPHNPSLDHEKYLRSFRQKHPILRQESVSSAGELDTWIRDADSEAPDIVQSSSFSGSLKAG